MNEKPEKKYHRRIIVIIFIICILILVYYLNSQDRYLFIFTINQKIIVHFLWIVMLICILTLIKCQSRILRCGLYGFLGMCLLVNGLLFIWQCKRAGEEYYVFTSPSKTNSCIIHEKRRTTYFYKDSMFTIKRLGVDMVGCSIRAFRDGHYSVSWSSEETVFISYLLMSVDRYFDVSIDLTEPKRLFLGEIVIKNSIECN